MSTVEEIVEAVKELPPDKMDEVRRQLIVFWFLESPQIGADTAKAERTLRSYWDGDIHSESLQIKRAHPRRPPIQIKGKPISETVVEERR